VPSEICRRIVLRRRPVGEPVFEDFALEQVPMPRPRAGEVLVRTLWLSIDPYMRGRLSDAPSYTAPVALGEPIHGECAGVVVESLHDAFRPGQPVVGMGGWQDHFVLPAEALRPVEERDLPLSWQLGVLGMPGHTAYAALFGVARPLPGETVLVPAAAGAVGAVAGQLAREHGCRVVGVAGGPEKCRYVVEELGFDACVDRRAPDLVERLRAACPDGVDVYLELVGGEVLWAALELCNLHARIPVVGGIAWYNLPALPEGPDRVPRLMRTILVRRLRLTGFLVWDWAHLARPFRRRVAQLLRAGRLRTREHVYEGLESAPRALVDLLAGRTFGKVLVRVHPEPPQGV